MLMLAAMMLMQPQSPPPQSPEDVASGNWWKCLSPGPQFYARSSEPPELVVGAIFARCEPSATAYYKSMEPGGPAAAAAQLVATHTIYHDRLLGEMMQLRAPATPH